MKAEKQSKVLQAGLIQPKLERLRLSFVDNRPRTIQQAQIIEEIQNQYSVREKNESANIPTQLKSHLLMTGVFPIQCSRRLIDAPITFKDTEVEEGTGTISQSRQRGRPPRLYQSPRPSKPSQQEKIRNKLHSRYTDIKGVVNALNSRGVRPDHDSWLLYELAKKELQLRIEVSKYYTEVDPGHMLRMEQLRGICSRALSCVKKAKDYNDKKARSDLRVRVDMEEWVREAVDSSAEKPVDELSPSPAEKPVDELSQQIKPPLPERSKRSREVFINYIDRIICASIEDPNVTLETILQDPNVTSDWDILKSKEIWEFYHQ